jgi:hypothetical protein
MIYCLQFLDLGIERYDFLKIGSNLDLKFYFNSRLNQNRPRGVFLLVRTGSDGSTF